MLARPSGGTEATAAEDPNPTEAQQRPTGGTEAHLCLGAPQSPSPEPQPEPQPEAAARWKKHVVQWHGCPWQVRLGKYMQDMRDDAHSNRALRRPVKVELLFTCMFEEVQALKAACVSHVTSHLPLCSL